MLSLCNKTSCFSYTSLRCSHYFLYYLYFQLFLCVYTLSASLFYSDWIYQIENKGAMYRLLKEKNKFEVELLKSQFSPHFLFNTLNSIYSKCHSTSPEAAKMIYNLSNFLIEQHA